MSEAESQVKFHDRMAGLYSLAGFGVLLSVGCLPKELLKPFLGELCFGKPGSW
jgi:hypothetical protein